MFSHSTWPLLKFMTIRLHRHSAPRTVTEWRADFIAIGAPLLGALAQTSEFAAWEGGDLSAAEPPQTEVDENDAADESDGDAAE